MDVYNRTKRFPVLCKNQAFDDDYRLHFCYEFTNMLLKYRAIKRRKRFLAGGSLLAPGAVAVSPAAPQIILKAQ
jgi:hypothetical protein